MVIQPLSLMKLRISFSIALNPLAKKDIWDVPSPAVRPRDITFL